MATEVLGDERSLRTGRRERALAQMEAHDLDILVLGRQSNIRYVSGAQQLWVAGTRPFAPSCVLLRNGAVHLLSTWDEGVPEDIPHENLYGIAWNPMNTIENLRKIPGAATARRVGSDALSPGFAQLLPMAFPNAELVDGEPAIRAARRIKTAEEIATLRESVRVAEVGLAAGLASQCQIQISYAIGIAQPTSIAIDTFGTGELNEAELIKLVREHFDLRPKGIIQMLDLLRPIYAKSAAYGHFGREEPEFTWEKTDKAAALRAAAGL